MKTILQFLTALGFFALCYSCGIRKLEEKGVYEEVSHETYQDYLTDSTVNLIDLRTQREYQKSHIHGAINASYFSGKFNRIIDTLDLDTNQTILIYCETQHRSLLVAKKLYKHGFDEIIDLDKGMRLWRKKGYPTQYPEQSDKK